MSQEGTSSNAVEISPERMKIVEETMELAKTNYLNPRIDSVFHRLFGTEEGKDLLIYLLSSILPPGEVEEDIELLNPIFHRETLEGKTCILDIHARGPKGRCYDVEM
jgi:hypothetical protein